MMSRNALRLLVAILLSWTASAQQQASTTRLTIQEAVDRAQKFPSIEASEEQVNAAAAGIRIARTNYLPSVNALGQVNRATRKNVFGLLLPQTVIPNISGPVLGTNDGTNVWGSAVGVLISWEPFDFGRRRALVQSVEATRERAELTTKRTQFDVQTTAAAAFLTLLASQLTVRGQKRRLTALKSWYGLLKPPSMRSSGPARICPVRIQKSMPLRRNSCKLSNRSTSPEQRSPNTPALPQKIWPLHPGSFCNSHPMPRPSPGTWRTIQRRKSISAIQESEARLKVLQGTYRPTFDLQAGAYARGTGALTNGSTLGGANGLGPNYFNVAARFTVTFPLMALPSIRAKKQANCNRAIISAMYRQVLATFRRNWTALKRLWRKRAGLRLKLRRR